MWPLKRALLRHALAHRRRERRGGRHGALGRGISHSVRREVALAWYFKDSMAAAAVQETTDQILARVDAAGRSDAAVYAVVDWLD